MNLEANQSFAIRSATYTPVPAKTGVFGILEISEQRAKTSKVYTRRYLVHDLGMSQDEMGRAFRIKKSLDANKSEEFYNVLISIFGPRQHRCECKGFASHGLCCHVESLQALASNGELGIAPIGEGKGKEPLPDKAPQKRT